MGIARCKRGARMMREIERLKKGGIAIGFWMETEKTKSFGECASLDDFFAQFVCGGGGEGKGKGNEDSPIDLSSPSPNPNADTSSLLPPSHQNQAKDLSSPINAAAAANKNPLITPPPPPLHHNPTGDSSPINAAAAANKNPLTTPPPPPLHHNPTGEELVMSVPQTPPVAPVAPVAAADDLFTQFVYKGGEGSKGNPNSKPPPPISVRARNSSPPPPQQSQITNNNQKLALSVLGSTQIAPIATAHESKSMDDLLAKLEGEGKGGIDWADNLSTPIPKSPPLTAAPAAAATAAAVTSCLTALSPLPAPPSLVQNWRPYPMSYVVMVDGEIKVMSRFFPPPPNAIIIYVEEDEEVEEVEVEVEVLMVPASNHTRKRKNTENKAEETLESDGDAENTKKKKKKKKQRSVLTAAEKRKDCYRRLVNGSSAWVPPASPYKLLQEQHFSDPWRVVIICMLLNLTTGMQVKQILDDLFLLCPNAEAATMVSTEELMKLLKPLGLWRKRARSIKRFSCQYLESDWTHITQLHGVGKYAADAYAIFCVGEPEEVVPEDHKLVDYWRFVCEKHTIEHQQRSAGELAVAESSGGTVCWSQNCVIHDPLVC